MFCAVATTPVITVNERVAAHLEDDHTLSLHGDDGTDDEGDASDEDGDEEIRDIGQSKLADLARRSLRIRRRVHLQLNRQRRRQQQQQQEEAKQIERLRRDKDILTNFMRLRLYETQSSFSSCSDVASSSGMERSSDSERRGGAAATAAVAGDSEPSGEDVLSRRGAGSVSGMSASTRGGVGGGAGGAGGESSARSRRRDDIRKILRQRRRRRRLMLLSCGQGGVEQYTDKTRNAAVVMGEKDIKLSLKQQRHAMAATRGFSLPACARPSGLTALARTHRRVGQARAALQLTEQALLLDPVSAEALLERSQCYQQLGQPRLALLDAEDALDLDRTNDAAFLHKAQALYSMGHFEKALVMFHRGSRLRPDNPAFSSGIQQAREAIMNIIGCLSKDFTLSSCERLLRYDVWPDEDSSVGSARRAAECADCRGALGAGLGAGLGAFGADRAGGSNALLWDDHWADESSASGADRTSEASGGGVTGLCESCHTAHQYVDLQRRATLTGLGGLVGMASGVEEEARQIALILSVTNAHDGRNKHLREKLMVISPSPPPSDGFSRRTAPSRRRPTPQPPPERLARSTMIRSGSSSSSSRGQPRRPLRPQEDPSAADSAISRPGADRVPPSLGCDATFLQQIARDPRLQGLPVSGLAEEAVCYLKGRQVFWQRRGPIAPGRPTRQGRQGRALGRGKEAAGEPKIRAAV